MLRKLCSITQALRSVEQPRLNLHRYPPLLNRMDEFHYGIERVHVVGDPSSEFYTACVTTVKSLGDVALVEAITDDVSGLLVPHAELILGIEPNATLNLQNYLAGRRIYDILRITVGDGIQKEGIITGDD